MEEFITQRLGSIPPERCNPDTRQHRDDRSDHGPGGGDMGLGSTPGVDGSWINATCEANYGKLLEWRALVAPGRQMTFDEERTVFEGVFGRRRDSVIGLGPIPNKSVREASQPSATSSFQQDQLNEIQQLRINQERLERSLKKTERKHKRSDNLLKEVPASINPKRKFNMSSSSDDVDGSDDDDGYDDGYDGEDDA